MTATPAKKSDLGVRALSAVVMIAVAGTALWLGGWVWAAFVVAVALGVLWEWWGLVAALASSKVSRAIWIAGGAGYVALGTCSLVLIRNGLEGAGQVLLIVGAVIFTDIGAYFAGRLIGGPKIAPTISPSKTWAGLLGGMIAASLALAWIAAAWESGLCEVFYPQARSFGFDGPCSGIIAFSPSSDRPLWSALVGSLVAVVAQSGDFFESWMKRRAGVKDSGKLIPGHGGLFDRVDGLLAVLFVFGLLLVFSYFGAK